MAPGCWSVCVNAACMSVLECRRSNQPSATVALLTQVTFHNSETGALSAIFKTPICKLVLPSPSPHFLYSSTSPPLSPTSSNSILSVLLSISNPYFPFPTPCPFLHATLLLSLLPPFHILPHSLPPLPILYLSPSLPHPFPPPL